MKTCIAFLLLSFVGLIVASPTSPLDQWYQTYNSLLNQGHASQQNDAKVAHWWSSVYRAFAPKTGKQNKQDQVTALLESLASAEDDEESYDAQDISVLQSLFNTLAHVEEEKANEMDSKSARAQFLRGLGSTIFNSAKDYLTDKYCPSAVSPTATV